LINTRAVAAKGYGFLFYVFRGARMLDKKILLRTDGLWNTWAKRLAQQADRTVAELIRDVIYLMIFDDELGQEITRRLVVDQVSYNK
jgi:hypothetical protein